MTALGTLLVLFIVIVVAGGLGIAFLFLSKNQKVKNVWFYFLSVFGMLIAYVSATSGPRNYIGEQIVAWAVGFLCIIAIILKVKKPKKVMISYLLVTFSVVFGIADIFFI